MPLVRTPLTGNQIVAMGSVSLQRNYTLTSSAGVTSFDVNEIPVGGLPSLMYWVRLNTALGGVVFEPLFAVQNLTAAGVTSSDWRPFTNGAILVPTNVFVFTTRAAVAMAAARFFLPGAPPQTINIDVIITAGG
jgi:hypothetical protein